MTKAVNNLMNRLYTISILGGTGKEGKGLAYRWALAGHKIIIGSRQLEKAINSADEINKLLNTDNCITGKLNLEAAEKGEIIVLTVPYGAHSALINEVKDIVIGKVFIDVTVPLVPPKVTKVQLPSAGSASMEAQNILGDQVSVVAAFQNISYENLLNTSSVDCDVLVCSNYKEPLDIVLNLVKDAGLIGWDAGPLDNALVVEGLTSVLININKKYGVHASGIKITGVPRMVEE